MKKKGLVVSALLFCLAWAVAAAQVEPVGLVFGNSFARRLTEAFNAWAGTAQTVFSGETLVAAGVPFDGGRLMNSVCLQEAEGASDLSADRGVRGGQQKALLRGFRLLGGLQESGREHVYVSGFNPGSFETADYRALSLEGETRMDVLRFAFPVADGGAKEEGLAVRFFEDGRTTLWLTGDASLLAAYEKVLRPAATPTPEPAAEQEMTLTVRIRDGKAVNVRQTPSKSGEAIGWAFGGESYPLLSTAENGWVEIRLPNGKTGFVSPKMIR